MLNVRDIYNNSYFLELNKTTPIYFKRYFGGQKASAGVTVLASYLANFDSVSVIAYSPLRTCRSEV